MSVRGYVQGAAWEPRGSELVAAGLLGDMTLSVEWVGLFDDDVSDDEPGFLSINDNVLTYSGVDEATDRLMLTSPFPVAASIDDRVYLVSGGQVMVDYVASVTMGEGDPAEVVIPFAERDLWPEGDYDDPVQVLLSDDLTRIEEVPGRTPSRDGAYTYNPLAMGYKSVEQTIEPNTWTRITDWVIFDLADVTHDAGVFTINTDGLYDLRIAASFDSNDAGSRAVRARINGVPTRFVKIGASGTTVAETNQIHRLAVADTVVFEAWHLAGQPLAVLGGSTGRPTAMAILRVAP